MCFFAKNQNIFLLMKTITNHNLTVWICNSIDFDCVFNLICLNWIRDHHILETHLNRSVWKANLCI